MALTKKDTIMIGDEFTRVRELFEDKFGELGKKFSRIEETLDEHGDKIDALMAETHDIHQEFGAYRDKTDSKIEKIQDFVGMPSSTS